MNKNGDPKKIILKNAKKGAKLGTSNLKITELPACSLTKCFAALARCRCRKPGASDMKIGLAFP